MTGGTIDAGRALELCRPLLDRRPLLIVSDFDGTLSPTVPDPWAAAIIPAARRALRTLAGRPGIDVVVLSGRTASDVAARVRVGGARYLGNHGLERSTLPRRGRAETIVVTLPDDSDDHERDAIRIGRAMASLVAEPWLVVEPKGPAVTFHYRQAPDVEAAGRRVADAVERLDPDGRFVRFPGRRALELRPPGAAAKGEAVAALLDELHPAAALVLGDDRSDAEAFRTLRERRATGGVDGLALAVLARDEVPVDVRVAADAVLASPAEAARLLSRFVRATAQRVPNR